MKDRRTRAAWLLPMIASWIVCLLLSTCALAASPPDYSALSEAIEEVQAAIDSLAPYRATLNRANEAADAKQAELDKVQEEMAEKVRAVQTATGELVGAAAAVEAKIDVLRRLLNPILPEPLEPTPAPAVQFRAKYLCEGSPEDQWPMTREPLLWRLTTDR